MTSQPDGGRRKLHVVQVIYSMHIGGAENAVVHIARGLDRSRFDVSVCCTSNLGVLAEALIAEGIDVRLVAPASRHLRHLTPFYLRRELKRRRADIVHTHSTPSMLHAGPLAAFGLVPPWIHTFHFGNYPLPNPKEMKAERFFCRYPDQLVAVSDAQRQSIVTHHGLDPRRIVTVLNGVGENPYLDTMVRRQLRTELGIGDEEKVVGCISVLGRQKGLTHLLNAAKLLFDRGQRFRVLIAGGGPLEATLRQEAADLDLGDRAVFTGWRPDNLQLLTTLDVFVMSSLWEAMPLALLEAMAARRPIVVTDVGDNRGIVGNGECGIVVPPADAAALADGIAKCLDDPQLSSSLGLHALERYRSLYTTRHMLAQYEQHYDRLARI